jgi:hypothetical protein
MNKFLEALFEDARQEPEAIKEYFRLFNLHFPLLVKSVLNSQQLPTSGKPQSG